MSYSRHLLDSWRPAYSTNPSPPRRNTPSPRPRTTSQEGYYNTAVGHRRSKSDSAIAGGVPRDRANGILDFVTPDFIREISVGQVLRVGFRENMSPTSIFHQQITGKDSPEDHMCVVMAINGDVAEVCPVTSFHNGKTPVSQRPDFWRSCVWLDSGRTTSEPPEYPAGPNACRETLSLDRSRLTIAHTGHGSWVRTDRTFRIELVNLQRFNFQEKLKLDRHSVATVQRQLKVWNPLWVSSEPRRHSAPACLETTTTSRSEQIMSKDTWRRREACPVA